MEGRYVDNIRRMRPVIHCITNCVSVNDCANILLACGASPIMADAPEEARDITLLSKGLVLNIGMLNESKLKTMGISGKVAMDKGIPVVLDPVGAGVSPYRTQAVQTLLGEMCISVIRANAGEIRALVTGETNTGGVDSDLRSDADICRELALRTGAVVVCTSKTDIVTDGNRCVSVSGGHPMMHSVTGAGCQLSALMGAFVAANKDDIMGAAIAAAWIMKRCGEIAHGRLTKLDGNATYRNYITDAVYNFTADDMEGFGYEICT